MDSYKTKEYGKDEIYDSDISYLYDGKDMPSWKIFYYIYLTQGKPKKIVLDVNEYKSARLSLLKTGVISKSEYAASTFIEFLSMLKKYRIIRSLPSSLDDRFIKVIDHDKATIIQNIEGRIRPDEKFQEELRVIRGERILKALP
ncbi:MAG: hypothetical protein QW478_04950 [Candidatus Micrarchaeaceae archaeon]